MHSWPSPRAGRCGQVWIRGKPGAVPVRGTLLCNGHRPAAPEEDEPPRGRTSSSLTLDD